MITLDQTIDKNYNELRLSGSDCQIEQISKKITLDPHKLYASIPIIDRYLASLEITLDEAIAFPTYKFANYHMSELVAELQPNTVSAIYKSGFNFLSGQNNQIANAVEKAEFVEDFSFNFEDSATIELPTTTLFASSIVASILFWFYLVAQLLVNAFMLIASRTIQLTSEVFNLEESFFSALVVPLVLTVIATFAAIKLLAFLII